MAKFWFTARPYLVEALRASEDPVTPYQLYCLLKGGHYHTWYIAEDAVVKGVFVTEPLWTSKGWVNNVPFCGIESGNLRLLNKAWNVWEDHAKEWGFVGTKFISADRRFNAIAQRRGYRPRYIEYVKEF